MLPPGPKTRWIRATARFYIDRNLQEIGDVVELDRITAASLVAYGKAAFTDPPTDAPQTPAPADPPASTKKGK